MKGSLLNPSTGLTTITLLLAVSSVSAATHYVSLESTNPTPPYTNWQNAARVIQDAVDAAGAGDQVVVTNGIYAEGGRAAVGTLTNRVAVGKPLVLSSVNGPQATVIDGGSAVGCVYLTNGATLSGFTLSNGVADNGGGVFCESTNAVMSNCVLTANSASSYGGGCYYGTLNGCTLTGNSAYAQPHLPSTGGAAYHCVLNNCLLSGNSAQLGGGAAYSTLNNCTLTSNISAGPYENGGGAVDSLLYNCTLSGNWAWFGGGVSGGTLYNCTLSGNSAYMGGGAYSSSLSNCVLASNSAIQGGGGAYLGSLISCTVTDNTSTIDGGGTFNSYVSACTVAGNSAGVNGGGASDGTLNNCTLTGNTAYSGGGAASADVLGCTLSGNSASQGGGVYGGNLWNCTLTYNSGGGAWACMLRNCVLTGNAGGGVYGATLYNCTLTGNAGGGVYWATLYNCIVYFNTASGGANYDASSTLNYCCATPLPPNGVGNIALDPQLASTSHLSAGSPCRGAGSAAAAAGMDIDGEAWGVPPSIGCDEYHPGAVTGPLAVSLLANYTNVTVGYPVGLTALIEGRTTESVWDFGDGTVVSNQAYTAHAWTTPGDYPVVLWAYNESYPAGVSATVHVQVGWPVHYVSAGCTNSQAPYLSWATAATNIQDAVDAALEPGALVLVTNGTYSTGGRALGAGGLLNRVAVDKPLVLQSVNGPQFTVIQGANLSGGEGTIRCVYLTHGASLSRFTLTNGVADSGGGVWAESAAVVVSNCVLAGNQASGGGGGVYGATVNNCTLTGNRAGSGGGAYGGTLNGCALTGNSASSEGGGTYGGTLNGCALSGNSASWGGGASWSTLTDCTLTGNCVSTAVGSGGGAYECALHNCILYFNTALNGANYNVSSGLNYCCTTPLPAGTGNIALDPQLASTSHLSPRSPCRGAGSAAYAAGTDIDGEPWGTPPSIGCDEYHAGAVTGLLSVAILAPYTNVTVGYTLGLTAAIEGRAAASVWDFGDGLVASNWPCATHAWSTAGDYTVVLRAYNESHPEGVTGSLAVHVTPTVYYVSAGNPNPVAPYTNWATAAQTIQDAVDADVIPGAIVLVGDGHYSTGGRAVGNSSNRVAITKSLAVRSVNGPQFTIIDGGRSNRCVFLTDGASLTGFTLTNGYADSGGGVWCTSTNAALTNCTLAGNSAAGPFSPSFAGGGGAYSGTLCNCTLTDDFAVTGGGASGSTLYNCTLTRNRVARDSRLNGGIGGGAVSSALYNCTLSGNMADAGGDGGGAVSSTLYNCTLNGNTGPYSGGADYCTLYNCTLSGNSTSSGGGGASHSTLYNCALSGNWYNGADASMLYNCTLRGNSGYGAYGSTLYNCTLTGNSASWGGGGADGSTLTNCIVYYNTASSGGANYGSSSTLYYCCTTPLPTKGVGNITSAPLFVDYANGNLRLLSNSPCINAGNNSGLTNTVMNPPQLAPWVWFTNLFDLDGRPRTVGGTVDMGAYEFQPGVSGAFIGWLQQYGLPTDGSADYADPDHDGLNNWQEWVCGTNPTDALSALRVVSVLLTGTTTKVTWQSVVGVDYFLQRSTNLVSPFMLLATNVVGLAGTTSCADTNATGAGPFFYRVGVQSW